uniref:Uncharacterized protein n=1 Tax=viral metagenome TaxID=1070528 RepID=A0A6C0IYI5_9ZZZZ
MFGFFLQTEQTFKLPSKAIPLAEFPQMCSAGSSRWPDLLPEVSQVVPQLIKPTSTTVNIPLFVPMRLKEGKLELIDLSRPTSERFCLVFYPNPKIPPRDLPIVKEYWSLIRPMIICRDVSGYYLGGPGDPGILFFQMTEESTADAWIRSATSGFTEALPYGSPTFSPERIYLQRHRSR